MYASCPRLLRLCMTATLLLSGIGHAPSALAQKKGAHRDAAVSDAALVRSLPGFENGQAEVNGTRIHYVTGGKGTPLFLLPGWPETWWEYHQIMPALAKEFRVIVVDIRGMGSSAKPASGYDKKMMARDVYELAKTDRRTWRGSVPKRHWACSILMRYQRHHGPTRSLSAARFVAARSGYSRSCMLRP